MQKMTCTSKRTHTTIQDLAKLLRLLVSGTTLTQKDMAATLKVSSATITRMLHSARTEYKMVILRPIGRGPYRIESWGLLDQRALLALNEKGFRKAK